MAVLLESRYWRTNARPNCYFITSKRIWCARSHWNCKFYLLEYNWTDIGQIQLPPTTKNLWSNFWVDQIQSIHLISTHLSPWASKYILNNPCPLCYLCPKLSKLWAGGMTFCLLHDPGISLEFLSGKCCHRPFQLSSRYADFGLHHHHQIPTLPTPPRAWTIIIKRSKLIKNRFRAETQLVIVESCPYYSEVQISSPEFISTKYLEDYSLKLQCICASSSFNQSIQ